MKLSILHALTHGLWLMDRNAMEDYRPLVNRMINGEKVEFNFHQEDLTILSPSASAVGIKTWANRDGDTVTDFEEKLANAPKGSVMVLPLTGPVMKEAYCGAVGLNTLSSYLKQIDAAPNFIGTILFANTPGGSASGVAEFANLIKSLNKPVVSYVEDMAASAGLWITSATRQVILSSKHSMVGSLGAYSTMYDTKKYYEQEGIRKIEIYAPQSSRKNKVFRDITSDDATVAEAGKVEYADRFLKPLVDDFQKSVKTNRRATASKFTDAVMEGDIFNGTEAIAVGLADSIGSFDTAVKTIVQLSKKAA
jgi:protease-4